MNQGILDFRLPILDWGQAKESLHTHHCEENGKISDPQSQIKNQKLKISNSWVSRLVNGISVIIPSGEEKLLRWFFQTQKDVNKRLIKQVLDKENEDISRNAERGARKRTKNNSEFPNKPLTDDQIRTELESKYGVTISRHSIAHCRKEMGIPPAKRRLSGYKYPPLSANFSMLYPLTVGSVQNNAQASPGIYELRLKAKEVRYPNGKTQIIYIGRTKNIRKRLKEHLSKNSKNGNTRNFLYQQQCLFRYISLAEDLREEEKRFYNLFVSTYGAAPKCNKVSP